MQRAKSQAGLTITELVIAVGMIGLLASLAIPNFLSYQARARRSEAYTNLGGIARSEKGYFAERDLYFEQPVMQPTDPVDLGANNHAWTAAAEADFLDLGWTPEGRVRYSYNVVTGESGGVGCACAGVCFTASAFGDVDANDVVSVLSYMVEGPGGTRCPASGSVTAPLGPAEEIVRHPSFGEY